MKNNRKLNCKKGFAQTDYVVAIGIFILIFALSVQYVSNYFSSIGDTTNTRVMNSQATALLDIVERGYEPGHWPQTAANSSTVLLLHLDNSTSDSSQYGNNGTINSANCSAGVSGKLDTGCSFDGIDDNITVANSSSLTFTSSLTISIWVKANGGSEASFVDSKAGGFNGYALQQSSSNPSFAAFSVANNSADQTVTGDVVINDSSWHHVAGVFDSGTLRLFVDGLLDNTASASFTSLTAPTRPTTIGSSATGGTRFNGTLDEVVIYNRTLNESEIYNLWAYENLLDRIGLSTRAYRFFVVVNNSGPYWKNQSQAVETIGNELVKLNFTELGYGANIPSVAVYEANGSRVGYEISGNIVTFRTAVNANSAKNFTVYFDDDSNFREQTQSITGVDNLSEVIEPVQPIWLIQNKKMTALSDANYTRVKNGTGLPRDFGIRMNDVDANNNVLSFGPPVPPSGNVVSFRRFALYQNASGAIRKGRLTIQVW